MDKRIKNVGVAIIFVSILLVFTVIMTGSFDKIEYPVLDEDKYEDYKQSNIEIENDFNSVREGNLSSELSFLNQTNINHKYGDKLSKEKIALISNLNFPDLFKREKGFSEDITNKGLYINNTYDNNNEFIQSLLILNANENNFTSHADYSSDSLTFKVNISLNSMMEIKNRLLGPDVIFTPSSFNFMNMNQNVAYIYDEATMQYDVGLRDFELPNNQIFGVYEEIYDAYLEDDTIYVYSNLISYKAKYKFNLNTDEYTKDLRLEIYNGVFKDLNIEVTNFFEEEIEYALVNNSYKFMYVFKKASDGNYYFTTSMNIK